MSSREHYSAKESVHVPLASAAAVRLRRARAAHRRADDADPPRQAPRGVREQPQRGARKASRSAGQERRGLIKTSQRGARRHPHRRAQQRRRTREPHDVLADHGAREGRRADRARSREAINGTFGGFDASRSRSTRPASAASAAAGSGSSTAGGKLVDRQHRQPGQPDDGRQDSPIFGIDVWEHAYYLKYQNRRPGLPRGVVERRQLGRSQQAPQVRRIREGGNRNVQDQAGSRVNPSSS